MLFLCNMWFSILFADRSPIGIWTEADETGRTDVINSLILHFIRRGTPSTKMIIYKKNVDFDW